MSALAACFPAALLGAAAVLLAVSPLARKLAGVHRYPFFADLMQLTWTADCSLPGAGTVGFAGCDPFQRPYNYPPVWATAARLLGIGRDSTTWLGVVLIVVLIAVVAWVTLLVRTHLTPGGVVLITAASVSPPVLLLVARGNIDIVLFALVVASVATTGRRVGVWLAPLLIGVAAGLKLWPAGAIAGQRGRARLAWAAVAVAVGVGALSLTTLQAIRGATPSITDASFGAGVLPATVLGGGARVTGTDTLVGVTLLAFLVIVGAVTGLGARLTDVADAMRANTVAGAVTAAGAGLFLATYVLTTSFDYRLHVLVLLVAGVGASVRARRSAGLRVVAALALCALWFSYASRVAQPVGDLANLLLAAVLCLAAGQVAVRALRRARPVDQG